MEKKEILFFSELEVGWEIDKKIIDKIYSRYNGACPLKKERSDDRQMALEALFKMIQ